MYFFAEQHHTMEKENVLTMVVVCVGGDGLDPMLVMLKMEISRTDLL